MCLVKLNTRWRHCAAACGDLLLTNHWDTCAAERSYIYLYTHYCEVSSWPFKLNYTSHMYSMKFSALYIKGLAHETWACRVKTVTCSQIVSIANIFISLIHTLSSNESLAGCENEAWIWADTFIHKWGILKSILDKWCHSVIIHKGWFLVMMWSLGTELTDS